MGHGKKMQTAAALVFCAVCLMIAGGLMFGATESKDASENSKPYVAIIAKSTTSAYWKSTFAGAKAAGTAYNLELSFEGPENEEDYETQNEMIRAAVQRGAGAIVFSAVDYNANAKAIEEAAGAGVKIVVIDNDVNSNRASCRISTDNYQAGQMAAEAVLEAEWEELKVGIVNFDENSQNGQEREQGFRDASAESERVRIIDSINVISTTEEAKNGTIQMLKEHPDINVIVTFNEWTSLGVGYAIEELRLGEDVTVVAFDSNVVSVGMLETGEVDALIVQNPYAMGYLGVEYAYDLINGIKLKETEVYTSTTLVTKENMFEPECQRALFSFD